MYKLWKRVISLTLSLALLIPLAACGGALSPDDATTYIQGILDENYKGIYDAEFLEMIDSTETEAQEIYQNSIEVEAEHPQRSSAASSSSCTRRSTPRPPTPWTLPRRSTRPPTA